MRRNERAMGESTETLAPTAQRLVAAARRILSRSGFNAITVDAVATEAGEYRDAVRYYFGSKDGLIAAVVDALSSDENFEKSCEVETGQSVAERIHVRVEADRRIAQNTAAFCDLLHLLPHVLGNDDLRGRVATLYEWYRSQYLQCFGEPPEGMSERELRNYASLLIAVCDGLALQKALAPDDIDLEDLFALVEELVRRAIVPVLQGEVRPARS